MIYKLKQDLAHTLTVVTTGALFSFCASYSNLSTAQSLDDAVQTQLATGTGGLACRVLFAGGGNPTGNLLEICERTTPLGAEPGSSGGASATPASLPFEQTAGDDTRARETSEIQLDSNWSLFFTLENGSIDRSQSSLEGPYDSTIQRLIAGTTYRVNSQLSISGLIDTSTIEGDFENGGNFKDESTGVNFMTSYQYNDQISGQISAFYQKMSSERERIASFGDTYNGFQLPTWDGTPDADFSPDKFGLAGNIDYDFTYKRFSIMPQIGIEWFKTDFGTYSETDDLDSGLQLTFHDDVMESFQTKVGVTTSYPINTSKGVFIPQVSLDWRHEFEHEGRFVAVSFVEDLNSTKFTYKSNDLDANFFDVNVGGVFVFPHGYQGFFNIQTLVSNTLYDSLIFSAGLRMEL
ncbi:hypothetical protein TDB9533_01135 [Thalassocella blandensis]|nr:hypothetical protein TDB9533_01135 [Thalassocella blandensis]